jgi:SAM-dependent methyltransferase
MVTESRERWLEGREALDDRSLDGGTAETMLGQIALTNVLFGGNAAVKHGILQLTRGTPDFASLTLLDIGAGAGDVTRLACEVLGSYRTTAISLDHHKTSAWLCSAKGIIPVIADIRHLPLRSQSVDIVIVSMVLHHLPRCEAVALIGQLHAAARLGVVIADLQRSRLAAAGFNLAGRMLRLHPVTRRDGVLSIRRGFTASELAAIIADAGVREATVHRRAGWRVLAYWRTQHEDS